MLKEAFNCNETANRNDFPLLQILEHMLHVGYIIQNRTKPNDRKLW